VRICHVISGDLWAGAEVMGFRLLTGLAGIKGVELSVILLNEGKLAREIRTLDVPIDVVEETRLNFFQINKRFQENLMKFQPDIVHTHRLKENIMGYLSSRKAGRGIHLICTQHGLDEPQLRLKWKLLSRANRYVLSRHFQNIVAVSEDIRIKLSEKNGLPSEKIVVIHNGTEIPEEIHSDRGNHPFTIGSAGRFFPIKDYPFFVEVAAEVNRYAKDIRFELAGEGPALEDINDRIQRYGLQDVFRLKGFVEDISVFYTGLDLYINTSIHEGFPMSVLEAMSHGLPVVAAKEGGIKDIVEDGVHGFMIEGRDPKRFAQKCLAIYQDRNLRQSMGVASIEKVTREYSIKTMAGKYYELYVKVLSQTGRANLASGAQG
jgi:glycosyltransferase involved in cell wall biosynthesis